MRIRYNTYNNKNHLFYKNRQINDNLEQQAQALFKSWFVDFEPFRNGKFVDSELGTTPKELPIVYIENIPHNIESGKRPKGGATLEGIPRQAGIFYSKFLYLWRRISLQQNVYQRACLPFRLNG